MFSCIVLCTYLVDMHPHAIIFAHLCLLLATKIVANSTNTIVHSSLPHSYNLFLWSSPMHSLSLSVFSHMMVFIALELRRPCLLGWCCINSLLQAFDSLSDFHLSMHYIACSPLSTTFYCRSFLPRLCSVCTICPLTPLPSPCDYLPSTFVPCGVVIFSFCGHLPFTSPNATHILSLTWPQCHWLPRLINFYQK